MNSSFYIKYVLLVLLIQHSFYLPAQNQRASDSLQNLIKSTTNDTIKFSALIELSNLYKNNNSDKALKSAQQALSISVKLKYPSKIAFAHNRLGDFYLQKGNYGSASGHFFKALKMYEDLNDSSGISRNYHKIAEICYSQNNFEKALDYLNKSLAICLKLNQKKEISANYNSMGIIYTMTGKYKKALECYYKVLKISEETGNKQGVAACFANMSIVYYQMGKLDMAIENTLKAIKIEEEIGDKENLLSRYSNLGAIYIQAQKYNEAENALQKAMEYVKDVNDKNLLKNIYDNYSELYERKNDFQKAYEYTKKFSDLKDTIYNESNSRQANELTSKYESEKRELTINNLEKDKTLSKEKLESEKNFKIYLLFFSLFISAFGFVLFKGNVRKKNANLALSFAYDEIELKNKDITDSINYSKRIQDASLAPKELKYKLFPDAFVLFKPKDIVSGDFYWFAEKDGKRLIAACDCTGHGVPGALMSMIGNNILNQIVNEKGITSPDEILNNLHNELRKALKQEGQNITQDGMDIALLTFNNETEIEYAGAHRPLWIIRKSDNDELKIDNTSSQQLVSNKQQLSEIKAEKYSIGGQQSEKERKFSKHKMNLAKGDCIYIFSDGYADQFGGKEEKRFMTKRFKDLLLANYSKSMPEQENVLLKTIEAWKGDREQVDDILVIGLRI